MILNSYIPIHQIIFCAGFVCIVAATMIAASTTAFADCTNPPGTAGKVIYNADYSVPQFCNGTYWVSMAGGDGGAAADDLGNHTATQALDMGGNPIDNVADPSDAQDAATKAYVDAEVSGFSESDPQVGTLTSGKWCTTNGTTVTCTSDAPGGGDVPTHIKATNTTNSGNFGGIQAMRTWIQSRGCSGYDVCTPDDLMKYTARNGIPIAGDNTLYWLLYGFESGSAQNCRDWTSTSGAQDGGVVSRSPFGSQQMSVYTASCGSSYAVLCCLF